MNSSYDSRMGLTGMAMTGGFDAKQTSTRMFMFQLAESNDINKVTIILKSLASKSRESLHLINKKQMLGTKLIKLIKKYCNADFNYDQ